MDKIDKKTKLPSYYDNGKNRGGSLYNVATKRGWNAYLFDVVKRLERGGKKDDLELEITKSIGVLELWLKEKEIKKKSKKKKKCKKLK